MKGSEFEIYKVEFPPLDEGTKDLLYRISVNISKELRNPLIPLLGGKFADDYFVIPCDGCERHSVVHRRKIADAIRSSASIVCPHCRVYAFAVSRVKAKRVRYQYAKEPYILSRPRGKRLTADLSFQEVSSLFFLHHLPDTIREA